RVDPALALAGAVARSPDAERARERRAERLLEAVQSAGPLGTADVVGAGALEDLDAAPHIVGRVLGVHIHADDDVAARATDGVVHPGRLDPFRIVDEDHARVAFAEPGDDRPCPVAGATVGDEDLHALGGVVLSPHAGEAGLDVPFLVEAGHGDGYERRWQLS